MPRLRAPAVQLPYAALGLLAVASACGPEIVTPRDAGRDVASADAADVAMIFDVVNESASCRNDMECSDNVYCNGEERCLGGRCQTSPPPCDDRHSCTTDTCDEAMRTCAHMPDNSMCGDMNACNGIERCDPTAAGSSATTGCMPIDPMGVVDCDDANTCTIDNCDARVGCVHSPRDLDGDGHVDRACTIDGTPGGPAGDDCNDGDATTYPGAMEICDDNRDNNCNGSVDYAETSCSPTNDTCATATRLPGPGTYWGSTTGLRDDYPLGCNTGAFSDAVFEFTTTAAQDVTISTSSALSNAAVALLPDGDCTMVTALRCIRGTTSAGPSITVRSVPPGRYRIIAETGSAAGPFRITLRLDAPTMAPIEDICPRTEPNPAVELNDGMPHMATLGTLENDYTLSCNAAGTGGRDAVFRLTITAMSDVTVAATSPVGVTYVSFRNSPCPNDASERRCFTGSGASPPTMSQRGMAPGVYWVLVENSSNSTVTVQAMVTPAAMPAPGDTCPGVVVMPGGPAVTVPGTSIFRGSDVGTACGTGTTTGSNYSDAIFQFTIPAVRDVVVTATRPTSPGVAVQMEVFSMCGARASTLGACVSAVSASRRLAGLAAGTYYVVVETNTGAGTIPDLQLTVTATDPSLRPAVEACPGQVAMTNGTPVTINWGTTGMAGTIGAGPDVGTSCGSRGTTVAYRDAVVQYTVTAPMDVDISVNPSGTLVYRDLRTTCLNFSSTHPSVPCASLSAVRSQRIRAQPAGTYFIVVETSTVSPMPTIVTVTATPPAPAVIYSVAPAPATVIWRHVCGMAGIASVLPGVDDGTAPATAPWPMRVYGAPIAMGAGLTIASNGWVSFVAGAPLGSLTGMIPDASSFQPHQLVAPFWSDIVLGATGVCWGSIGTAPNRQFVVEWDGWREFGGSGTGSFEVIVNEALPTQNNIIDVIYNAMVGITRTGGSGIENDDASLFTVIPGPLTAPRAVRLTPMPM